MPERFDRADIRFLVVCAVLLAACAFVVARYFERAFPEASIDFRYNRGQSRAIAETFLREQGADLDGYRHASRFDHDDTAKVFLERTLGLEQANPILGRDVKAWTWFHRWFRPLETEEWSVDVAPTGEIVAFNHRIPEEKAMPAITEEAAVTAATRFLARAGLDPAKFTLVTRSERKLPNRLERTLEWESHERPGGAPIRCKVTFDGDRITGFRQFLDVPEAWIRDYRDLRSKNNAASTVDTVFMLLTIVAALVVFIARLRAIDLQNRFALGSGIVGAVLMTLVALNGLPSDLAYYDTRTSFTAFVVKSVVFALLQGLAVGVFLVVIVGAGEALYRERWPRLLAIPRLFGRSALRSKRVFLGFVLGYTLVGVFMAYQVLFYLVSAKFGAWSPADIPYDDILNTALPWVAVLFMGFFPAMSEEYMSRAFSIPFFEKLLRSRVAAIVVAGFIWGFGHAAYPNQPFYIRGVEVGIAGVAIGILLYRFGLLPLLIWHYTVDAVYTSLLLVRSHNAYYIASASVAALVFALPLVASIAMYFRRGGFEPDGELENGAIGTAAAPPEITEAEPPAVQATGPAISVSRKRWIALAVALAIAAVLAAIRPTGLDDVSAYPITSDRAIELARAHLKELGGGTPPERVIALPASGFRSWDAGSSREDGGSPDGFDLVSLEYIVARAPRHADDAIHALTHHVEAATWVVRFFTPREKREIFIEIDPRKGQITGYHEYVDEKAPGARLDAASAEAIARAELPRRGIRPAQLERKEALSFNQPNRVDWLFHFEDRAPLAAEAKRRVSVRVAGDRVTQFAKTVWIPEKDRREATETTIANTLFMIAKIVGVLGLLTLAVLGFVIAFRDRGFVWREPLRATAWLVIPAAIVVALNWPLAVSSYDTSIAWPTFLVVLVVGLGLQGGVQLGAIFLALSAIQSIHPWTARPLSLAVRSARGRSDLVAAATGGAVLLALAMISPWYARWFPGRVLLREIDAPSMVAIAAPLLSSLWEGLAAALVITAAAATIAHVFANTPDARRPLLRFATIAMIAFTIFDTSASLDQAPLMIVRSLIVAVVIWLVVTRIAAGHDLAIPLAVFGVSVLRDGASMIAQGRVDLAIQGVALIAILAAMALWIGGSVAGKATLVAAHSDVPGTELG